MKALITGSEGFAGKYMRHELEDHGYLVTGVDLVSEKNTVVQDLLDTRSVEELIKGERPDVIIHLAGQADVALSWKIPQKTFEINVLAAVNILEAVRKYCASCRVVLVGSADQYGSLGSAGINVTESIPLSPTTPYGVSKMAQEEIASVYASAYGLLVCMTRSFNHTGAGQRTGFMVPDFASGIAAVEAGHATTIRVGNLETKRDLTHVKDVVRAYRLIAEKGIPGSVYNVGSGNSYSARNVLDRLLTMARCDVKVEQDVSRMRPVDTPEIRCCHDRLTEDTGWLPEIVLDDILGDVLNYYRERENAK